MLLQAGPDAALPIVLLTMSTAEMSERHMTAGSTGNYSHECPAEQSDNVLQRKVAPLTVVYVCLPVTCVQPPCLFATSPLVLLSPCPSSTSKPAQR